MDETEIISNRMEKLFLSSQWCDLQFCLTNSQTGKPELLQAHRIILASASPVFEALCYGPLAEKGTISVPDIDLEVFTLMLKFLYTDKITFESAEVASNILYTAKKYLLPNLVNLAQKYLLSNISDQNCFDLYNLAIMLENYDLEEKTFNHIRRRMNFITDFINDNNLSLNLIRALVTSNKINCDEVTLLKLAHRWALHICDSTDLVKSGENIRNIMVQNGIFKNIRWRALVDLDLHNVIPEVLSKDEISQCAFVSLPLREPWPMVPVFVHRCIETEVTCQNFTPFSNDLTVSTKIEVNKTLTLGGIFIRAKNKNENGLPCRNLTDYKEKMDINIYKGTELLLSQKICNYVSYGRSFKVELSEKITFKENCCYNCCVVLYSPLQEYQWGELSKVTKTPSGLKVKCVESIEFRSGLIANPRLFGLVTGFEFFY